MTNQNAKPRNFIFSILICHFIHSDLIPKKVVIPAKPVPACLKQGAGIQEKTGFRSLPRTGYGVKPGMTNAIRFMSLCIDLDFWTLDFRRVDFRYKI
jgi:hypothetical protein